MKKTITFGIPCYNSSEYMDHCIESILEGSDYADDVQIVIVDDGSVRMILPLKLTLGRNATPTSLRQSIRKTAATALLL